MDAKATVKRTIGLAGAGNRAFFETVKRPVKYQTRDLSVTVGADVSGVPSHHFGSRMVTLTIQTPEGHSTVLVSNDEALKIGVALVAFADRAGATR